MQDFTSNGLTLKYKTHGVPRDQAEMVVVWAHGWGTSHASFDALIAPFTARAHHIALDFLGFGESSMPPEDWSLDNYTDFIATWLKAENLPPVMWVGHSFGCRVGVQLAATHPARVHAMCLIAGAGLKKKRPPLQRFKLWAQIRTFKLCRNLLPDGALKNRIIHYFGSADYNSAGGLRQIFVRVVNQYLEAEATRITCPVTLIYGANDTETPPEFGERYARLIPNADLHILDGQDHYSVLQKGRHPVIKILSHWLSQT